jgi:transposase-like protein
MTVEERRRRRFSEEFRKDQVALYDLGKITIKEISDSYQVKTGSVRRWISKYSKKGLPTPILISSPKDINRTRDLEKENKKLKEIIGEQQVELVYKNQLLKVMTERLGADFEKK